MKRIVAASLLSICLFAGCSTWERTAFQTLSASKAVEDKAQADYEARVIPHNQCAYDIINKAKATQALAVNAMVTYEDAKSTTAQQAAENDLAQLAPIIASIQTLGTNTCAEAK